MKRILRPVSADTETAFDDKYIFSLTDIVNLLEQIEELDEYDIGLETNIDGSSLLIIGDHEYVIQ